MGNFISLVTILLIGWTRVNGTSLFETIYLLLGAMTLGAKLFQIIGDGAVTSAWGNEDGFVENVTFELI